MKRRSFMKSVGASGLIAGLPVSSAIANEKKLELKQGDVILFQGDSITDAGRQKKDPVANDGLGRGYPNVIAKSLLLSTFCPFLEDQGYIGSGTFHRANDVARICRTLCHRAATKEGRDSGCF